MAYPNLSALSPGQFLAHLISAPPPGANTQPNTLAQPSAPQQPATQPTQFNPSGNVTTYYVPNYQGAGPRYITIGVGAGWQWDTPESYQQKIASGNLPRVPLQDANAFNAFNQQFQAQATQDRAAASSNNWADINNPNIPLWRKMNAVGAYLINSGAIGAGREDQAYQAFMKLPEDVRNAYIQMHTNPKAFWEQQGQPQMLQRYFGYTDEDLQGDMPSWLKRAAGIADSSPNNTNPNLPKPGAVDIYNPGPYIAELLRGQKPGYVFGTKVPRPNQINQATWNRFDPTQQDVMQAYWKAVGIPAPSALAEMKKYWLEGSPYQPVRNLA